jgi:hypothetical protein
MHVGTIEVSRALPVAGRRMIGPWCFLDRYGPLTFSEGRPMDVAPHPHIGLQTVTWLLDGEVIHDDSLRSEAVVRPGGVNVMTSGRGIAHAERTPTANSGRLHGVQLWVALPDRQLHSPPSFEHVVEVPRVETPGGLVQVFSGNLIGAASPAPHHSDIVGADLQVYRGAPLSLPLEPRYEHALLVLAGRAAVDSQPLEPRMLYYLEVGRSEITFTSAEGGRVLLIGGPPFPEQIVMWWNFVARSAEEIAAARADWEAQRRFGDVPAYDGPRTPAPSLSRFVAPTPLS